MKGGECFGQFSGRVDHTEYQIIGRFPPSRFSTQIEIKDGADFIQPWHRHRRTAVQNNDNVVRYFTKCPDKFIVATGGHFQVSPIKTLTFIFIG